MNINKKIEAAFKQAMRIIAKDLGTTLANLNVWIRFDRMGTPFFIARHGDKALKEIPITQLIKSKMIGVRLCRKKLTHFFRCVHAAYMIEQKMTNPCAVSLLLYNSKTENEICLGIYVGRAAARAYRLDQVAELTGVGSAELN